MAGNYVCSDVPGQYVWKQGVLYRCMERGLWILFEDIDHAPSDIVLNLILLKALHLAFHKLTSLQGGPNIIVNLGLKIIILLDISHQVCMGN